MKISQEHAILITNIYLSKQYDAQRLRTVEWIGRQELETWKHRQSAEENPQDRLSGNHAAEDRVRRVAVEDLVFSHAQAKKTPIRPWDFAWNCHCLLKCVQDNSPSPDKM